MLNRCAAIALQSPRLLSRGHRSMKRIRTTRPTYLFGDSCLTWIRSRRTRLQQAWWRSPLWTIFGIQTRPQCTPFQKACRKPRWHRRRHNNYCHRGCSTRRYRRIRRRHRWLLDCSLSLQSLVTQCVALWFTMPINSFLLIFIINSIKLQEFCNLLAEDDLQKSFYLID